MAHTPKPGEPEFEPRKPALRTYGGGPHDLIAFQSLGEIARQFFEAEKVLRSLLTAPVFRIDNSPALQRWVNNRHLVHESPSGRKELVHA
jgi:hypothetical protein